MVEPNVEIIQNDFMMKPKIKRASEIPILPG